LRRLGIPTARDRCVQASLKLVLEPIFEADFHPCSYGFRPMRRAQDAIEEIHHFGRLSYEWILEGDITSCLEPSSHCQRVHGGGVEEGSPVRGCARSAAGCRLAATVAIFFLLAFSPFHAVRSARRRRA